MKKRLFFTILTTFFLSIPVAAADIDSMTLDELKTAYRELEAKYNELAGIEVVEPSTNNTTDANIPLVTYSDILSGAYNGQKVYIDAVVDKMNITSNNSCSFSLWYPHNETYVYGDSDSFYDIKENSPEACFLNYENGDLIRYETGIYGDGSFGPTSLLSTQLIEKINIDEVHSGYKSNCPELPYEDVLRNPDNYSGTICKISGTIFQIIDEGSYSAEYLISANSGYVYTAWHDDEKIRGNRFLEDDVVCLYGEFEGLKTYDTLTGEKTVPYITIHLMELN